MRTGSIADDDDTNKATLCARLCDQTAAGQAFVVRVRRDDDEPAIAEALLRRRKSKRTRGIQRFRSLHVSLHKSIDEASRRSVHSAAFVKARSGPGCRRYVARSREMRSIGLGRMNACKPTDRWISSMRSRPARSTARRARLT